MPLRTMAIAATLVLALLLAASPAAAGEATWNIDARAPGVAVSPQLYGIFFEEINHAGDGGLYAELVRNRSFEDAATPEGWELARGEGGVGEIALDTSRPLNDRNPHALRLTVQAGSAGAANGGYWGIAVRPGAAYRYSLYGRGDPAFRGPLAVRLESAAGKPLAAAAVARLTPDWQRFEGTLTASEGDPAARLVVSAAQPGTVWLDMVSLFPAAPWKGRANGLRPDLAEMLVGLQPAFFRFPGGCFCEGDRLANAWRWKATLGDLARRPGTRNLWGYRSTDGLGYHEYLQLCEDLGAAPMYVINAGMPHTDVVPLDRLDEWVQDALDAVEYANGPVTSEWGARRAAAGHPAPFGLKYLEIGNENGGPRYEERYARFYDALKARYPDLPLIANVPVRGRPVEILDEHYYNGPEWFLANAARYDGYDRNGPKIYVGEYAVTRDAGQGNLRAAVAEAAFMTGMERNADVVTMASYAPLFVNVRDRRWNPDLIAFDGAAAFGTPSYSVQELFSRNRADTALPGRLTSGTLATTPPVGRVGLGTWRTAAEFRDVRVTQKGKPLFAADFRAGAPGWRVVRGDWEARDGLYRQTAEREDVRAVAGDPAWGDYTLELKARKTAGAEGFLVMFRVRDDRNWYWWNVGGWGNARLAIEKSTGGAKSIVGREVPGPIETGRWYDLRVEVEGNRFRCYLDGQLVHDAEDRPLAALYAVAGRRGRDELVLKVANASPEPQETTVTLEGVAAVAPRGSVTVLTAESPSAENSLANPRAVVPVTRALAGLSPRFRHTFPANSVTVLHLRLAGG